MMNETSERAMPSMETGQEGERGVSVEGVTLLGGGDRMSSLAGGEEIPVQPSAGIVHVEEELYSQPINDYATMITGEEAAKSEKPRLLRGGEEESVGVNSSMEQFSSYGEGAMASNQVYQNQYTTNTSNPYSIATTPATSENKTNTEESTSNLNDVQAQSNFPSDANGRSVNNSMPSGPHGSTNNYPDLDHYQQQSEQQKCYHGQVPDNNEFTSSTSSAAAAVDEELYSPRLPTVSSIAVQSNLMGDSIANNDDNKEILVDTSSDFEGIKNASNKPYVGEHETLTSNAGMNSTAMMGTTETDVTISISNTADQVPQQHPSVVRHRDVENGTDGIDGRGVPKAEKASNEIGTGVPVANAVACDASNPAAIKNSDNAYYNNEHFADFSEYDEQIPRKVDSNDDTAALSPTHSDEIDAVSESLSEIARRKRRRRRIMFLLVMTFVAVVLAICLSLGAITVFARSKESTTSTSATGDGSPEQSHISSVNVTTSIFVDPPLAQDISKGQESDEDDGALIIAEQETEVPTLNETTYPTEYNDTWWPSNETWYPSNETWWTWDNGTEATVPPTALTTPAVTTVATVPETSPMIQTAPPVVSTTPPIATTTPPIDTATTFPPEPEPEPEPIFIFDNSDLILPTLSTLTSASFLADDTTAQGRAFRWLAREDLALPMDFTLLPQRYALVTMNFGLHVNSSTFVDPNTHECEWTGVTCDAGMVITGINWARLGLSGTIVPEIRYLSDSLTDLDLGENNNLHGDLEYFWSLTNLRTLYLHENAFSGSISAKIGQMTDLESLYLGKNQLTGGLPFALASQSGKPKPLRYLTLDHNQLTGFLPPNWRMRALYYLDLGHNNLNGPLPLDWDINMISLRHLYLDHNQLTGTIPAYFSQLGRGRMRQMYLNDNMFSGAVPSDGWSTDGFLSNLNFDNNDLSEELADSVCQLSVFEEGELVELRADCDICTCNSLCDTQCT